MQNKSIRASFRFSPDTDRMLRELALQDKRSLANTIEVLVAREHARRQIERAFARGVLPGQTKEDVNGSCDV